jgi:hypothetical protein
LGKNTEASEAKADPPQLENTRDRDLVSGEIIHDDEIIPSRACCPLSRSMLLSQSPAEENMVRAITEGAEVVALSPSLFHSKTVRHLTPAPLTGPGEYVEGADNLYEQSEGFQRENHLIAAALRAPTGLTLVPWRLAGSHDHEARAHHPGCNQDGEGSASHEREA